MPYMSSIPRPSPNPDPNDESSDFGVTTYFSFLLILPSHLRSMEISKQNAKMPTILLQKIHMNNALEEKSPYLFLIILTIIFDALIIRKLYKDVKLFCCAEASTPRPRGNNQPTRPIDYLIFNPGRNEDEVRITIEAEAGLIENGLPRYSGEVKAHGGLSELPNYVSVAGDSPPYYNV